MRGGDETKQQRLCAPLLVALILCVSSGLCDAHWPRIGGFLPWASRASTHVLPTDQTGLRHQTRGVLSDNPTLLPSSPVEGAGARHVQNQHQEEQLVDPTTEYVDRFGLKLPAPAFAKAVRKAALPVGSTGRRVVLLTMANKYALKVMGDLFLGSLANVTHAASGTSLAQHLVLAGFTPECVAACTAMDHGQACVQDEVAVIGGSVVAVHSGGWRHTGFARVKMIVDALSMGVDALFLDTDWLVFKDPLPYIWARTGDVFATMVCHTVYDDTTPNTTWVFPGHVNIGLTYFKASPKALRSAEGWMHRMLALYQRTRKVWDQAQFPNAMHNFAGPLGLGLVILHGERFPSWCRGGCGCDWRGLALGASATWLKRRLTPDMCPPYAMSQWFMFHFPCNPNVTIKRPQMLDTLDMYMRARAQGLLVPGPEATAGPPAQQQQQQHQQHQQQQQQQQQAAAAPGVAGLGAGRRMQQAGEAREERQHLLQPGQPRRMPQSGGSGRGGAAAAGRTQAAAAAAALTDDYGVRLPSADVAGALRRAAVPVGRDGARAVLLAAAGAAELAAAGDLFLGSLANVTHAASGTSLAQHLVLAGFTPECVAACTAMDHGQACVRDEVAELPAAGGGGGGAGVLGGGGGALLRAKLLVHALSIGLDVLLLDVGWLVLQDPIPQILGSQADVVAAPAGCSVAAAPGGEAAAPGTGTTWGDPGCQRGSSWEASEQLVFFRATSAALRCAEAWLYAMLTDMQQGREPQPQAALADALRHCTGALNLGLAALNPEEFPRDGCLACSGGGESGSQAVVGSDEQAAKSALPAGPCTQQAVRRWRLVGGRCGGRQHELRTSMLELLGRYQEAVG